MFYQLNQFNNMKKYPYTKVHFIRQGEVKVTFYNDKSVLNIEEELLKPIMEEIGIERYLIEDSTITNILANQFMNFPKNQKNQLNGYLSINGNYIPCKESNSKEKKYLNNDDVEEEVCIIKGVNGMDKLKSKVVDINDCLRTAVAKIRSTLLHIKTTTITEEYAEEFNS